MNLKNDAQLQNNIEKMETRCYYTSCSPPFLGIVVHEVGQVETPDYASELGGCFWIEGVNVYVNK
jgi:hypothetical protein